MMGKLFLLPLLAATSHFTNVFALPLDTPSASSSSSPLKSRAEVDCSNVQSALNAQCWAALNMNDFLSNWNKTTPTCTPKSNASSTTVVTSVVTAAAAAASASSSASDEPFCCEPGEAWSTCFMRYGTGVSGLDCVVMNPQLCTLQTGQINNTNLTGQIHYALHAIVTINAFYYSYYTALQFATSATNLEITPLITALDLQKKQSPLSDILSALTVVLAFFGAPSIAVSIIASTVSTTVKAAAQAFIISLQQSPGVTKALWPTGNEESQLIQIGNLQQALGNASAELGNRLNAALGVVMTDMPTFLSFNSQGQWTSGQDISIPQQTADLTIGLKTYITSIGLANNAYYSTPNFNQTFPSPQTARMGCKNWDSDNVCYWLDGAGYWSPDTHRPYQFFNTDSNKNPSPGKILTEIESNNWAYMPLLFDGAFNCTWQGQGGGSNFGIGFLPDGSLNVGCLSQLPQYRASSCTPCPAGCYLQDGKNCPFGTVPGNSGGPSTCQYYEGDPY